MKKNSIYAALALLLVSCQSPKAIDVGISNSFLISKAVLELHQIEKGSNIDYLKWKQKYPTSIEHEALEIYRSTPHIGK